MGHSVIQCDECGSMVMEGRNKWECDCGWEFPSPRPTPPVKHNNNSCFISEEELFSQLREAIKNNPNLVGSNYFKKD